MVNEGQITVTDGRSVGFAEFGAPAGTPVLWCHGGPGCRLEPGSEADAARAAGIRIIGIDRPGYGFSTPQPGRTIGEWASDGVAVADHLGIDRFVAVGVSTGGAYALALAVQAPERALGAIVGCGNTDMRWAQHHAMMTAANSERLWSSTTRDEAIAVALETFGEDGNKTQDLIDDEAALPFSPADREMLADPEFFAALMAPDRFTHGVQGYVDDRLADGPNRGWDSFDVSRVQCPVILLHGEQDRLVPPAHARHTAELVPQADLRIFPEHGHLSILREVLPAIIELHG